MQNRRKFIRDSLLTVSGAGLIPRYFPQLYESPGVTEKERKVLYRTPGSKGIRLPVISMGTAYANNPNLVRQAMDEGIKLFATAEANTNGNNQIMLGKAIKEHPRDSCVILTSIGELHHYEQEDGRSKTDIDTKIFMEHARQTLCATGIRAFPCSDCTNCTIHCQIGFNVRSKILDIARLQDVPEDFIHNL